MSGGMTMGRESWRPPVREGLFDGQVKRMALVAAGVLAVGGLGYTGYALLTRAPRSVPVIEADPSPVRIKPANPGGMQIVGAEEQIMGDKGASQADVMAPAAEVPQPQLLRAQIRAARQAAVPPPAAAPAQPAALAPLPPAPLPAPPAPRPTAPAAKGMQVQLAALDSEAAATAEWGRLAKRMPDLFRGRSPAVIRADRDGKTFWRLRTAGFADTADATRFCGEVKAKGAACSLASF